MRDFFFGVVVMPLAGLFLVLMFLLILPPIHYYLIDPWFDYWIANYEN